ncbi:MAG: Flagellar biosynthetic protein FlhB [Pseudomonadota bacterium]
MAEQSDSGERTEEPTAHKLRKAREDGQLPRSVELSAAAVTIGALAWLLFTGASVVTRLANGFAAGFVFDRQMLESPHLLPALFVARVGEGLLPVLPVLILTMVLAVGASFAMGGLNFSTKALAPKTDKLSPLQGFKRMFGVKAGVELAKAIAKFTVVGALLYASLTSNLASLAALGAMDVEPALAATGSIIMRSAVIVALGLVLIALIDVPFQRYDFMSKMKMSRQEIRDEMKDMEGRPEVKAQIRRRQREIATQKMMARVKDADVVITNPDHFSVALAYDPAGDGAPVVVASGIDHLALRIRTEAKQHGIEIFEAPPLARALYFTTEVEQTIPESLYVPVAQVIAYVFSLASVRPGQAPMDRPRPTVPRDMRFDASGQKEAA